MWLDLQRLASDELAGRSPWDRASIGAAAELIAEAQERSGLAAAGASYRIPFPLPGGFVSATEERFVWINGAQGGAELRSDAFVSISAASI